MKVTKYTNNTSFVWKTISDWTDYWFHNKQTYTDYETFIFSELILLTTAEGCFILLGSWMGVSVDKERLIGRLLCSAWASASEPWMGCVWKQQKNMPNFHGSNKLSWVLNVGLVDFHLFHATLNYYIPIAWHKTVVTPLLMQWSYHSLELSSWCSLNHD